LLGLDSFHFTDRHQIGLQRLEGTTVGAVVAFSLYRALDCEEEEEGGAEACPIVVAAPWVLLWCLICGYMRAGQAHGYAAVVAALTPLVLLLGPATGSLNSAWERIQKSAIGIGIYLLVDVLVLPEKLDRTLHLSFPRAVTHLHAALKPLADALVLLPCAACASRLSGEDEDENEENRGRSAPKGAEDDDFDAVAETTDVPAGMAPFPLPLPGSSSISSGSSSGSGSSRNNCSSDSDSNNSGSGAGDQLFMPAWAPLPQLEKTLAAALDAVDAELAQQARMLPLVPHEPHFFQAVFPISVYSDVNAALLACRRKLGMVRASLLAFCETVMVLVRAGKASRRVVQESIVPMLGQFDFARDAIGRPAPSPTIYLSGHPPAHPSPCLPLYALACLLACLLTRASSHSLSRQFLPTASRL
jgi:hypothetical protein